MQRTFFNLSLTLVTVIIVIFILLAIANGAGNGANFALVPHCNPGKQFKLLECPSADDSNSSLQRIHGT